MNTSLEPGDHLDHYRIEAHPEVSPEMQEIIYRALERDPAKRYAGAREFADDLKHPEKAVPADREEHRNWQHHRSPGQRMIWYYAMLAMIPVAIFVLLLYVARLK